LEQWSGLVQDGFAKKSIKNPSLILQLSTTRISIQSFCGFCCAQSATMTLACEG
jgi:hypothetical protein